MTHLCTTTSRVEENVWSEQTQTQQHPVTWHDQLHVAKQWKSALDNFLEILPCGELAGVLVGEKLAGCQQGNGEGVQVPSSVEWFFILLDDLDPKIPLARGCCVSGQIGADALLLLVVATFHYEICIDRK